MNKTLLVGRAGGDPEVKEFDNGDKIAKINLATSERWTDQKTGEKKEHTDWHNLVFKRGLAGVVENYVKKGQLLSIVGKNKTRSYESNGEKKYITEIMVDDMDMLGGNTGGSKTAEAPAKSIEVAEDDIPF
tara:strand:- start:6413 stop:6805 length:393 start_codon:yes stop_codon:yes gene_type:complete